MKLEVVLEEATSELSTNISVANSMIKADFGDSVMKVISGSEARLSTVNLRAIAWQGDTSPYSQVVAIKGITATTKVDLTPTIEQLSIFYDKDVCFVTENDGGIVTVYLIGQKLENDYLIPVILTEVEVDG